LARIAAIIKLYKRHLLSDSVFLPDSVRVRRCLSVRSSNVVYSSREPIRLPACIYI